MRNKRGIEVSFSWLFAIIVGAAILVFAIYGAGKILGMGGEITSTKVGKEIGILLNPLETSFESDKVTLMSLKSDTKIQNQCSSSGNFGKQILRISQKSFKKWSKESINLEFSNKYIFSEKEIEGKDFFIFSKPFNFPFKIADLVYITSSKIHYCFEDAPSFIKEDLIELEQENLHLENCSKESIRICFNYENSCDIEVNLNNKIVTKKEKSVFFETDALMYAAIFSDLEIYECQIQRLIKRANEILHLYQEKSKILIKKDCDPNVNLASFRSNLNQIEDSRNLYRIVDIMRNIDIENKNARCKLW